MDWIARHFSWESPVNSNAPRSIVFLLNLGLAQSTISQHLPYVKSAHKFQLFWIIGLKLGDLQPTSYECWTPSHMSLKFDCMRKVLKGDEFLNIKTRYPVFSSAKAYVILVDIDVDSLLVESLKWDGGWRGFVIENLILVAVTLAFISKNHRSARGRHSYDAFPWQLRKSGAKPYGKGSSPQKKTGKCGNFSQVGDPPSPPFGNPMFVKKN